MALVRSFRETNALEREYSFLSSGAAFSDTLRGACQLLPSMHKCHLINSMLARRFRETDALVREYAKEGGAMEVMQLSAVPGAYRGTSLIRNLQDRREAIGLGLL